MTGIINPCKDGNSNCIRCPLHFVQMRPGIRSVAYSHHFLRDAKHNPDALEIAQEVLDCDHEDYAELHKFERHVHGTAVFRAKRDSRHLLYGIDDRGTLIFLRLIKHYGEYQHFLSSDREILRSMGSSSPEPVLHPQHADAVETYTFFG